MFTSAWVRSSKARRTRQQVGRKPSACRLRVETLEDRCLLSGDMVLRWNEIMLAAVRIAGQSPPVASRTGAIVQAAVYEAVNAIDQTHTPYLVNIPAPTTASKEAAAAQAAHDALVGLFPAQATMLGLQLRASLQGIENGEAKTWGIRVGRAAAQILRAVRRFDGANRVVEYTPGSNPGDWQPTPPAFAAPQVPQWPSVTPFAIQSGAQFRAPQPPALTSAEYTAAFNQVKGLGSLNSATRTADQTEAAMFWQGVVAPNSAPGWWNQIAQGVADTFGMSLVDNARMFALVNLAGADALIASFETKYTYNYWRPVTAIQAADTDGNPDTEADPDWTPLMATPPHPSYLSNHSSFSMASAAVLASFFGTDAIPFSYSWDGLPGVTRSFAGFSAAAREAGQSRIWAGFHWNFDITPGEAMGQAVGTYVFENYLLPLAGPGGSPGGSTGNRLQAAPDIVTLLTATTGEPLPVLAEVAVVANGWTNPITPRGAEVAAGPLSLAAVLPDSARSEVVESLFEDFAVGVWAGFVLN